MKKARPVNGAICFFLCLGGALLWSYLGYALGNPEWASDPERFQGGQPQAVLVFAVCATIVTLVAVIFATIADLEP